MSKQMRKGQHESFVHGYMILSKPSNEKVRKEMDRIFPNSKPWFEKETENQPVKPDTVNPYRW
jgi:hypothetical protein